MPVTLHKSSKKASGPDYFRVQEQLSMLQDWLKMGRAEFCKNLIWILRKNPEPGEKLPPQFMNRRLVPFNFNATQLDLDNNLRDRNICLKYRQGGYTTWFIINRLFIPAITEPGVGCLLVSQKADMATAHLRMLRRAYRYFAFENPYDPYANGLATDFQENLLHLHYSNKKELIFDQLDSRVVCDSAEVEEVGQGLTINHAVCTEVARWPGKPEETLSNMKEAIAQPGTLDIESTANALGGYFYEECMRARDPNNKKPEFKYFFHQWWWQKEYFEVPPVDLASLTDEESKLRKQVHLDLKQIQWRRSKMIALRHNFPEKYPEDDISCFVFAGHLYFDREVIHQRMLELRAYIPETVQRDGDLQIFQKRIRGRRYVIGADVATGRMVSSNDTDYSVAKCIDMDSGEEMAVLRLRELPEEFAFDLAELGRYYNDALIAVERNNDGGNVITTLSSQCLYGNIYLHRDWTRKDRKQRVIELPGWPTTSKTRPFMLSELRKRVRSYPDLIYDRILVDEMLRFVIDPEKGVPAAAEGTHDDDVFASAIAHSVRLVATGYLDTLYMKRVKYDDDEEYEEAEAAGAVQ